MMLTRVRRYVWERRRGVLKMVGVVGGLYFVTSYLLEKLEEMRESLRQEQLAKENLKRRLFQNQQDCTFTILALLPGLGAQIMEEMDVEAVILILQSRSRSREDNHSSSREPSVSSNTPYHFVPQTDAPALPTLSTSGEPQLRIDTQAIQPSDTVNIDPSAMGQVGESSLSWVEQFTATSSNGARSPSVADAQLSDSMISESFSTISDVLSDLSQSSSLVDRLRGRTKGELWKDVKLLTFSRTLTVVYATTLLTLLTHIQLNIIGRTKYLKYLLQKSQKEREEPEVTVSSLIWETVSGMLFDSMSQEPEVPHTGPQLSEETERKFLLLSWWVTHRGWRQIGHTIQRVVEESMASISLKSKVTAADIQRILLEVRTKLEGKSEDQNAQRLNILGAMLPQGLENLKLTLLQDGSPTHILSPNGGDKEFDSLLEESCEIIASPSFPYILNASLNSAFHTFFVYLEKEVFTSTMTERDTNQPLRLVDVLPGMARWSHYAINGLPNEFVHRLSELPELSELSTYIYSSFGPKSN